jgi:hypothetical protein
MLLLIHLRMTPLPDYGFLVLCLYPGKGTLMDLCCFTILQVEAMNGENQPLVTDEPVEIEKKNQWKVQDFSKMADRLRRM